MLAIHLRALLHDPDAPRPGRPHAPSLLEQLGEKDRLRFPDSVWRPLPPGVPDTPEIRAAIIKPFDGPWMIKLTTGPDGGARLAAPPGDRSTGACPSMTSRRGGGCAAATMPVDMCSPAAT
jgi:hypothetical protein